MRLGLYLRHKCTSTGETRSKKTIYILLYGLRRNCTINLGFLVQGIASHLFQVVSIAKLFINFCVIKFNKIILFNQSFSVYGIFFKFTLFTRIYIVTLYIILQ